MPMNNPCSAPQPSPPPAARPPEARTAIDAVKSLLNESLTIRTSDGRIFVGTFVCVDKQLNIVLTNTDEYRIISSADADGDGVSERVDEKGRYVTMVMVPWRLVVKVEAKSLRRGLVDSGYPSDDFAAYT